MKSRFYPLFLIALLWSFISVQNSFSQIKVFDNGYVGINYTTNTPLSRFALNGQGSSAYQAYFYLPSSSISGGPFLSLTESGTSGAAKTIVAIMGKSNIGTGNNNYGLYGNANSSTVYTSGRAYGVIGLAGNATTGYNYGVYGYLTGSNNGAAVYGTSTGDTYISGKYAGYFNGNVKVTAEMWATVITQSDERIKSNIVSLKPDQSILKIKVLNPVSYNLKQRENINTISRSVADTSSVTQYYDPESRFFKKTKYGLLAQEVQKVYPDLVYEDEDGNLGIDYIGLIPVLISAVQEQQKKIDELEKEINGIRATSEQ